MAKGDNKPAATGTAGSKSAPINLDEVIKQLESLKPLRDLLPNVHAKMGWVAGQSERIPKRGKNKEQGYEFTTEADIVAEVTKFAFLAGLSIRMRYPNAPTYEHTKSSNNKDMMHCYIDGEIVVTDVVTKEEVVERYWGYSRDTGDKVLWKTKTGLKKYAYSQTFGVTTGDDPEAHPAGDEDYGKVEPPGGGNNNPPPADALAREQRKAERRELFGEIEKCMGTLVELKILPENQGDKLARLVMLLNTITKAEPEPKDWTGAIRVASNVQLQTFIDQLNGYIAEAQGGGAKAEPAEVVCEACGKKGAHDEGCPNAEPEPIAPGSDDTEHEEPHQEGLGIE